MSIHLTDPTTSRKIPLFRGDTIGDYQFTNGLWLATYEEEHGGVAVPAISDETVLLRRPRRFSGSLGSLLRGGVAFINEQRQHKTWDITKLAAGSAACMLAFLAGHNVVAANDSPASSPYIQQNGDNPNAQPVIIPTEGAPAPSTQPTIVEVVYRPVPSERQSVAPQPNVTITVTKTVAALSSPSEIPTPTPSTSTSSSPEPSPSNSVSASQSTPASPSQSPSSESSSQAPMLTDAPTPSASNS